MEFSITILGSSSALPTSKRHPSAHVLKVHERFFLIDCGEGTQMQLRKNRVKLGKIHDIFISHLHGDHLFGLYGLLSSLNLMGRTFPMNIYAPASFEEILQSHLADFDINLAFQINFIPLKSKKEKIILDDRLIEVTAFPLKHRVPTYGFVFREKLKPRNIIKEMISQYNIPLGKIPGIKSGEDFLTTDGQTIPNSAITNDPPMARSFAYCSDTAWFEKLAGFFSDVDLLYHEATFASDNAKLASETGHSTAGDAARVARDSGARKLVIGHFSSRYKNTNRHLEEARAIFPETVVAEDGMKLIVGH